MTNVKAPAERHRRKLRNFLVETGLNLTGFASVSGVQKPVLSKFLRGRDIRLSTWELIEDGMNGFDQAA